ncbi:hypothetical protein OCS_04079 [Ophiocordyceps sinensis CO18]|uniref:Uncharacterized protein n=1 Tax=Ophiocordyceps sinensis (strain Co18 / CGMCC 3.14243) TaxID=911162 RepID=T5A429_OPHSC|nr:hypothetical protein OCS_04079 [Ophiocordyceps sinensis CO18]
MTSARNTPAAAAAAAAAVRAGRVSPPSASASAPTAAPARRSAMATQARVLGKPQPDAVRVGAQAQRRHRRRPAGLDHARHVEVVRKDVLLGRHL